MRGAIKHNQRNTQCNQVGIASTREGCGKEVGANLMNVALKPNQKQSGVIRVRYPPRLRQMAASLSNWV